MVTTTIYEILEYNGTVTDKWSLLKGGNTVYRLEIDNSTIIKPTEYEYHNKEIGDWMLYKGYDIFKEGRS